jgi:hypothetical protein
VISFRPIVHPFFMIQTSPLRVLPYPTDRPVVCLCAITDCTEPHASDGCVKSSIQQESCHPLPPPGADACTAVDSPVYVEAVGCRQDRQRMDVWDISLQSETRDGPVCPAMHGAPQGDLDPRRPCHRSPTVACAGGPPGALGRLHRHKEPPARLGENRGFDGMRDRRGTHTPDQTQNSLKSSSSSGITRAASTTALD